jgi:hypothetical protein
MMVLRILRGATLLRCDGIGDLGPKINKWLISSEIRFRGKTKLTIPEICIRIQNPIRR